MTTEQVSAGWPALELEAHRAREAASWFWPSLVQLFARRYVQDERRMLPSLFREPVELERAEERFGDLSCRRVVGADPNTGAPARCSSRRMMVQPHRGRYRSFVCAECNYVVIVDGHNPEVRLKAFPPRDFGSPGAMADMAAFFARWSARWGR